LILKSKSIDYFDETSLLGQYANAVLFVFPPRLAKIVGPIASRIRRRYVREPAVLGEVDQAARVRVNVLFNIASLGVEPVGNVLASCIYYRLEQYITF
jgi:hypothetical protein